MAKKYVLRSGFPSFTVHVRAKGQLARGVTMTRGSGSLSDADFEAIRKHPVVKDMASEGTLHLPGCPELSKIFKATEKVKQARIARMSALKDERDKVREDNAERADEIDELREQNQTLAGELEELKKTVASLQKPATGGKGSTKQPNTPAQNKSAEGAATGDKTGEKS